MVAEVVEVWWAEEKGNLGAVVGPDPCALLVDGIGVFKRALEAGLAAERASKEKPKPGGPPSGRMRRP